MKLKIIITALMVLSGILCKGETDRMAGLRGEAMNLVDWLNINPSAQIAVFIAHQGKVILAMQPEGKSVEVYTIRFRQTLDGPLVRTLDRTLISTSLNDISKIFSILPDSRNDDTPKNDNYNPFHWYTMMYNPNSKMLFEADYNSSFPPNFFKDDYPISVFWWALFPEFCKYPE